jgi:hypothetical protein
VAIEPDCPQASASIGSGTQAISFRSHVRGARSVTAMSDPAPKQSTWYAVPDYGGGYPFDNPFAAYD